MEANQKRQKTMQTRGITVKQKKTFFQETLIKCLCPRKIKDMKKEDINPEDVIRKKYMFNMQKILK